MEKKLIKDNRKKDRGKETKENKCWSSGFPTKIKTSENWTEFTLNYYITYCIVMNLCNYKLFRLPSQIITKHFIPDRRLHFILESSKSSFWRDSRRLNSLNSFGKPCMFVISFLTLIGINIFSLHVFIFRY